MQLRLALKPGDSVRIVGLHRKPVRAIVVRLIDRDVDSDLISDEGYWTVTAGDLNRDVQRKHLKRVGRI